MGPPQDRIAMKADWQLQTDLGPLGFAHKTPETTPNRLELPPGLAEEVRDVKPQNSNSESPALELAPYPLGQQAT